MKRTITSTALSGEETRRLIGANQPPEGLLGSAHDFRGGHLGDELRAIREPRGLQRAQRTLRPAAPSEAGRSHKTLSNSGRRSGAELPAVRNGSETMATLGNMGGITGSGANRYGRVAIIL